MALSLLGRIKYPGSLPKRERGVAARLWAAAQTIYFDGMENDGLAELLSSISAGLRIDRFPGCHRKTLTFTLANLADGGLAIVSWRTKDAHSHHWVLAVGVEGIQSGKTFKPSTLLVLDPLLAEPLLCGYNGRIQLNSHPIRGSQVYVEYVANDGTSIPVTLTSAVAMHELE
jgi:hypothetical protein